MLGAFEAENNNDKDGNPAGGTIKGTGLSINWQDGPLGRDGDRKEPNGAFVETVIAAAKSRLEYYQQSNFKSGYNAEAMRFLDLALGQLNARTRNREDRKVEGTHSV